MDGRWLGLIVLAACAFHPGGVVARDAPADAPSARDVPGADAAPADAAADAATDAPAPPDAGFVCSAAGLLCAVGTTAVFTCNGACWVTCTGQATEPAASAACTAWGGRLAPLQAMADQTCLTATLFPSKASWLGLEQAPNQTSLTTGWSWNGDGLLLAYSNWAGGQPNDGDGTENGAEQCAYMSTSGAWQDTPCGTPFSNFACRHGP